MPAVQQLLVEGKVHIMHPCCREQHGSARGTCRRDTGFFLAYCRTSENEIPLGTAQCNTLVKNNSRCVYWQAIALKVPR